MTTKDLDCSDAVEKLKQLAEGIDFAMLITALDERPLHAVPMSTKKVDEAGAIWFLSGQDSTHNQNIDRDGKVQLVYANPSAMEFLTIYGDAIVSRDRAIIKGLYGKADDAWFDGVDDPNVTAICIRPLDAYYWDSKSNQLISLAKLGFSAVSGSQPDLTDQGELKL